MPKLVLSSVARNIKEMRQKKNLSQPKLAAAVGVAAMTVSKWERGVNPPARVVVVCQIARARI